MSRRRQLPSNEHEIRAVQSELVLPSAVIETLLPTLGIRLGIFQADDAYWNAYRHFERGELDSAGLAAGGLAPRLFRWPLVAHHSDILSPGDREGAGGGRTLTAAGSTGKIGSVTLAVTGEGHTGPLLPPFGLSWQHRPLVAPSSAAAAAPGTVAAHAAQQAAMTVSEVEVGSSAGDTGVAVVAASASITPITAAAAAVASRPAAQPAPVRHLGFGIIVDLDRPVHPTCQQQPGTGGDGAGDVQSVGPTAAVQDPHPATAQEAGPAEARAGRPPVPPHPGARVRRQCAEIFGTKHPPPWLRENERYGGGPMPPWYTRHPGATPVVPSAASFDGATTSPPVATSGVHRGGKRPRDGAPAMGRGTAAEVDAECAFDCDFTAQLGHERGRPRAHTDEASAQEPSAQARCQRQQSLHLLLPAANGSADAPMAEAAAVPSSELRPGAAARGAEDWLGTCDPSAIPQPREPPAEAAPFGELLYGAQRMGHDLCRRAKDPRGACARAWRSSWTRVILKMLEQLRRLLDARSAVSKYDGGNGGRSPERQEPLANHSQLRAAVQLLLLVATELPPGQGPRAGVAPEALDAIDYLLGSSPFVDFDGCDPQARAVLVDGALQLARLAGERGRVEPGWRDVLARVLQTLTGWLVRQGDVVRQLKLPSLECTADRKLGGLRWEPATVATIPDEQRLRELLAVQGGHQEVMHKMTASLSVLVGSLGSPLACRLLDREVVDALLQPSLPRGPHRADVLVLLHAAVLALAPAAQAGPPSAAVALREVCEVVAQSGLRGAAEQVLRSECRSPDQLLALDLQEAQAGLSCRDVVAPLLGTLYAVLLCKGALPGWAAVEAAVHSAATEVSGAYPYNPLRKAWDGGSDRRYRSLTLYLLAQVLRGLTRVGQQPLLSAALRSDGAGARVAGAGDQLGLLGAWLRAALDCGTRPMLAAFTAELLGCDHARHVFNAADSTAVVPSGDGSGSVEALAGKVAVAISGDVDGSVCAQLAAALMSGMVRERRLSDVRGVVSGLDLAWRALRRELPRSAAAVSPAAAAGDASAVQPSCGGASLGNGSGPPVATLRAHRAMACVVLAALEPCAAGWLCRHAAAGGSGAAAGPAGPYGAPGAPGPGHRVCAEQQGALRVLECVAETIADDAAALVRWEGAATGAGAPDPITRWGNQLRRDSSLGLLSDLVVVLARSADCRTDYAGDPAHPAEHTVLQRVLGITCVVVSELPSHAEAHASTNELLRTHVANAFMDHLRSPRAAADPADPADSSAQGSEARGGGAGEGNQPDKDAAARDNLARMLHRCIAGSLRSYVVEGLKVPVPQSAQARHAVNALAWLRSLLRHPAMAQPRLLERLLPPMLNLVVENLVTARSLLMSKALLLYDAENPDAHEDPTQQPQRQQQPPPPLALIRELLDTAVAVLAAAAGSDLVASKEEAYGTAQGSVRIDASPLLLMEPAPRGQLRAATGFAAGLLLRTCLECFSLPMESRQQRVLLAAAKPPEEERSLKVRLRLASCLGNPPALAEAERPKLARQTCGPDVVKLSAAPAAADGADGAVKMSEAAIGCITRLVLQLDPAGYTWALPIVDGAKQLTKEMATLGLRFTDTQRGAVLQLLRDQRSRDRLPVPQGPGRQGPAQGASQPPLPHPYPRPPSPGPPRNPSQDQEQRRQQTQRQDVGTVLGAGLVQSQAQASGPHTQAREVSPPTQPPQPARNAGVLAAGHGGRAEMSATQQRRQHPSEQAQQQHPVHPAARPAGVGANVAATRPGDGPSRVAAVDAGGAVVIAAASGAQRNRPKAHYVSADVIERREDHRVKMSGCIPFADLPTLLPSHPQGVQQQQAGAAQASQAGGSGARRQATGGGARAAAAQHDLPPVTGEAVEAKLLPMNNGKEVLRLALRDASVDVAKAMIVYVAGPQEVLKLISSDLVGRRTMVGIYGAVYLGQAARESRPGGPGGAAAGQAPWPLLAKLTLDSNSSRSCGLVVEPRTAYVTQQRIALTAQDHRAAAPTVLAATPATLAAADGGVTSRQGPTQPSQQVDTTAAVKQASSTPESYHARKAAVLTATSVADAASLPSGRGTVTAAAGAAVAPCPPLDIPRRHVVHRDVVSVDQPAAFLAPLVGHAVATASARSGRGGLGRPPSRPQQLEAATTTAAVTSSDTATAATASEPDAVPAGSAWRGILAASVGKSLAVANTVASAQPALESVVTAPDGSTTRGQGDKSALYEPRQGHGHEEPADCGIGFSVPATQLSDNEGEADGGPFAVMR